MTVPEIGPEDAAAQVASGEAILIDVREPDETAAAMIEGSLLTPMSALPGALETAEPAPDKTWIIVCRSGVRSARVCQYLGPTGPEGLPILNLSGGVIAWAGAGLPLVRAAI